MKLSVVIPCFNESKNIPLILERFREVIVDGMEVILVDNGSTDGSDLVLAAMLPRYPFAKTIRVEMNQGYGHGILQGLTYADGNFLGWTHADMQTDPRDVVSGWKLIQEEGGNDTLFVKGARQGRPLFDRFFSIGMGVFETLYLGQCLYEINAQPNLFSRRFYETWKNPPTDFALDLYALYMAQIKRQDIRRISVRFPERMHGKSNWNTGLAGKWKFIQRTLAFSRNLKRRGLS